MDASDSTSSPIMFRVYYGDGPLQLNKKFFFTLKPTAENSQVPIVYVSRFAGSIYVLMNNPLDVDCTVSWSYAEGRGNDNNQMKAKQMNQAVYLKGDQGRISFTARSASRDVAVNMKPSFYINPVASDINNGRIYNLDISALTYYYTVVAENLELSTNRLAWDFNGKQYSKTIQGQQSERFVITDSDVTRPVEPIIFSAYRFYLSKVIFVNNNRKYSLAPSSDPDKTTTLYISEKPTRQGLVYINLNIFNKANDNVMMRWAEKYAKFIPKDANNYQLRLPFAAAQGNSLIQFFSYAISTKEKLAMNRGESYYVQPTAYDTVWNVEIHRMGELSCMELFDLLYR